MVEQVAQEHLQPLRIQLTQLPPLMRLQTKPSALEHLLLLTSVETHLVQFTAGQITTQQLDWLLVALVT